MDIRFAQDLSLNLGHGNQSFLTTNPTLFGTTLVVISSLKTEEISGCS